MGVDLVSGLRDWLILRLAKKETVYAGRGVYHWINHEGKVVLRNTQKIVGFGSQQMMFSQYKGIVHTAEAEKAWDTLNSENAKKEAVKQSLAYMDWYEKQ